MVNVGDSVLSPCHQHSSLAAHGNPHQEADLQPAEPTASSRTDSKSAVQSPFSWIADSSARALEACQREQPDSSGNPNSTESAHSRGKSIGRGCEDVRWDLIALKVLIAKDTPDESTGTPLTCISIT